MRFLFKRNEIFSNLIILISGTAIAQLIIFVFQLILRRQYSPEEFGAFAVYLSIVGILSSFVSFKYELAIILPKKNNIAANIFIISILLSLFINIIISLIIVLFKPVLLGLLNFPINYSHWLYFIPISTFIFSFTQSVNYWLIRQKAYKQITKNKISRRSSEGIVQSTIGYLQNSIGLLTGEIIGNIVYSISGIFQLRNKNLKINYINFKTIIYGLKRYIEFPKYNAIPSLLNSASLLLPVIIINIIYTEKITGYFDLSRVLLTVPLALITTSLSNILLQNFADRKKQQKPIKDLLLNTFYILLVLSLIGCVIIYFFGVDIFSLIFGEKWKYSGEIAKILVFSYGIKFVVSPLSTVFIALEKIKIISIWQVFYFCSILVLFFLKNVSFYNFIIIYILIDLLCYCLYFILIIIVSNKYEKTINLKHT
ncbi:MAG: oligosaccharide flippase family protein [Bacteroidales bacterium]|nr:oligosaccharide flippase family protein [Bacteroidales bacterium]